MENIPEDWEELVKKVGLLKRNCFASVFERYFRLQEDGDVGQKRAVINYRQDETLLVCFDVNTRRRRIEYNIIYLR